MKDKNSARNQPCDEACSDAQVFVGLDAEPSGRWRQDRREDVVCQKKRCTWCDPWCDCPRKDEL